MASPPTPASRPAIFSSAVVCSQNNSTTGNLARMTDLTRGDELAVAIHTGDVDALEALVASNPGLASEPLGGRYGTRTPLHAVADWPGYFPNGPQTARILLAAGGDPNAREPKKGAETPLHWAASSDDTDVARVLIDGGADVDVPDGSIGTPLENAVGYACWNVARLLVERGARVDNLWTAAALGLLDRLRELIARPPAPSTDELSQAFWHACGAGQRRAAEFLLDQGADLNWEPEYAHGTALDAAQGLGTQQENVIRWLRERGARTAHQDT
jgi:ankyrin repeat protein